MKFRREEVLIPAMVGKGVEGQLFCWTTRRAGQKVLKISLKADDEQSSEELWAKVLGEGGSQEK